MTTIFKREWVTKSGARREAYRVTFIAKGKKRFKQFKSRSVAAAFVRRLGDYIEEQESAPVPSVSEVATLWLAACARGRDGDPPLEPETLRTYRAYVKNHINPRFGSREITSLTRAEVKVFRDELLNGLARVTAKKILTALKSIYTYAIDAEFTTVDPTAKVVVKTGGRHKKVVDIPSKGQMQRVLDAARRLEGHRLLRYRKVWQRYGLMLDVLVYCGLRLSELRGLHRDNLDLDNGRLRITQRADRTGRIGPPKSVQSRRTLYLPETLLPRLEAWLLTHNCELVFPSRTGTPMGQENIHERMWTVLLKEAEVPYFNLHAIRHFFASRLIESGANPKEVTAALGHADEGFTLETYGHLFFDDESEKMRRQRVNSLVLV